MYLHVPSRDNQSRLLSDQAHSVQLERVDDRRLRLQVTWTQRRRDPPLRWSGKTFVDSNNEANIVNFFQSSKSSRVENLVNAI